MRRAGLLLILLLAAVPAGCGRTLDRTQLDLCRRVIEALQPRDVAIREIRAAPVAGGVRIDYRSATAAAESGARVRFAVCSFADRPDTLGRFDLSGVETEDGKLGDARLLFLKRFWLAPLAADTPAVSAAHVPQVSMRVAYAAQQAVSALALASIYGLLACAYSLVYGLVGRINLAFGDIAVVGAYGAVGGVAAALAGLSSASAAMLVALAIATAGAALWSLVVGRVVIAPLHSRFRAGQPILVATIAVAICIQELLRLFQGARERWIPPFMNDPFALLKSEDFVVTMTPIQLLVVLAALAAAAGLLVAMARTAFGRQWRAFSDDPLAASLLGVDPAHHGSDLRAGGAECRARGMDARDPLRQCQPRDGNDALAEGAARRDRRRHRPCRRRADRRSFDRRGGRPISTSRAATSWCSRCWLRCSCCGPAACWVRPSRVRAKSRA